MFGNKPEPAVAKAENTKITEGEWRRVDMRSREILHLAEILSAGRKPQYITDAGLACVPLEITLHAEHGCSCHPHERCEWTRYRMSEGL